MSGGSKKTAQPARKHSRPCLTVDLNGQRKDAVATITAWLRDIEITEGVLNVAGSRESKSPGIQDRVYVWLVDVISEINGKLFYPLMEECEREPPMMVTE